MTNWITVWAASSGASATSTGAYGASQGAWASSSASASAQCAVGTTTTVTEKETIYVTVTPTTSSTTSLATSSATVAPIQSSSAPYYSITGAAHNSTSCASTGFVTITKSMPSGYVASSSSSSVGWSFPSGSW